MFSRLKAPLYLGVTASLLLGSIAYAQAPSGGTGGAAGTSGGTAPAQTAPGGGSSPSSPSSPSAQPSPSSSPAQTNPPAASTPGPGATSSSGVQSSGRTGGPATTLRRDSTSPNATVGRTDRSERFDSGRRISREDRLDRGGRVVIRDNRFDRGDRWRRDRFRPAFAFMGGPRVIVRPGWCRGLHRGWHWAPGYGEHAGRHRGLFRC